jgi:uroporphyrinogen III methyltransferase / synthase
MSDGPLAGRRILLTRSYTEEFLRLKECGADLIEIPTLRIVPALDFTGLDAAIARLRSYNWLIITSSNALRYFMDRMRLAGRDVRDLEHLRVCAIGFKTAENLGRYGIKADVVPDEFSAEGLIETFLKITGPSHDLSAFRFLLPRAERARDFFPDWVMRLGGVIDTPVAYRAEKPDYAKDNLDRLLFGHPISIATFTSGATFKNFLEIAGTSARALLEQSAIAVIGPVTKKAVEKAGYRVNIMPETASIDSMVESIIAWCTSNRMVRNETTGHEGAAKPAGDRESSS